MALKQETAEVLTAYLDGRLPAVEVEAWTVTIADDPSFSQDERDSLSILRLLLLEAGENLRPESEAIDFAWDLLAGTESSGTTTRNQNVTVEDRQERDLIAGAAY